MGRKSSIRVNDGCCISAADIPNALFKEDPEAAGLAFEERPLDEKLIQYSIQDATLLPVLYDTFDKSIQPLWRKKVEEEVPFSTHLCVLTAFPNCCLSLDFLEATVGPSDGLLRSVPVVTLI